MSKTILRLDASALAKSSCSLRLKYIVIDGYTIPLLYNDTQYGIAGHKFLATMALTGGKFDDAVVAALKILKKPCNIRKKKEHLTENHFIKTCFDYWEHLQSHDNSDLITVDGKPLVEQQFAIKEYEDDELIIETSGTIDKVTKIRGGMVCVGDYKFTSSWDSQAFLKQHRLAPQLKFYRRALFKMAEQAPDNSALKEITKFPIGMFIDGVFLKSGKETTFERSEIWNPKKDEVEEFDELVDMAIQRLAFSWRERNLRTIRDGMINGSCSNSYGSSSSNGALCQFYNVCSACDKIASAYILKNEFTQREYDPLMFGED